MGWEKDAFYDRDIKEHISAKVFSERRGFLTQNRRNFKIVSKDGMVVYLGAMGFFIGMQFNFC